MERNNMDKLVLCALMGDQEAQTDLNEQYKLLPLPILRRRGEPVCAKWGARDLPQV